MIPSHLVVPVWTYFYFVRLKVTQHERLTFFHTCGFMYFSHDKTPAAQLEPTGYT